MFNDSICLIQTLLRLTPGSLYSNMFQQGI